MTYRPAFVKQLDGSKYAGLNCTPTAGAMALDRETLGKETSTGWMIRAATGDTSGGTNQRQVADAIERDYRVELDVRTNIATAEALALLDKGCGMMLAGQSSATRGTQWQASETFGGNHQWYVNERRSNGDFLVYDPLADHRRPGIAQSPMWIPSHVVLDFASRLNVSDDPDHTYHALGKGHLYAVFTRDTEPHLTLWTGAKAIVPPQPRVVKVPAGRKANVRQGPSTAYPVRRRVPNGWTFQCHQVKTNGQTLNGSSTWYGNIDGQRWLHASAF